MRPYLADAVAKNYEQGLLTMETKLADLKKAHEAEVQAPPGNFKEQK